MMADVEIFLPDSAKLSVPVMLMSKARSQCIYFVRWFGVYYGHIF